MKRNGKFLKSLGAKSRDFAESFVFNGLTLVLFRYFHQLRFSRFKNTEFNALAPTFIHSTPYCRPASFAGLRRQFSSDFGSPIMGAAGVKFGGAGARPSRGKRL